MVHFKKPNLKNYQYGKNGGKKGENVNDDETKNIDKKSKLVRKFADREHHGYPGEEDRPGSEVDTCLEILRHGNVDDDRAGEDEVRE